MKANSSVRRLGSTILRSVSRSFYLSVQLLPARLRQPVALGYLLARSTDTIADTGKVSPDVRAERLATLAGAIQGQAPSGAATDLAASFAPLQTNSAERTLVQSIPSCLEWLENIDPVDGNEIRAVMQKIVQGQALDLHRFGNRDAIGSLASAADLDEYTYLVAGCVGEFWTRLCFRHVRRFTRRSEIEMADLGKRYGMGLQLINILRDARRDLRDGRCYFPEEELAAIRMGPVEILREPDRFLPIYRKWREKAEEELKSGMQYIGAIRNRRVRAATALPALIGARTLSLLRKAGATALHREIKVPRREVRTMLRSLVLSLASRSKIERMFQKYSR